MIKNRITLGAVLWGALALGTSHPARAVEGPSRTVEEQGPVRVGEKAPTFGGFLADGSVTSLSRLLGEGKGPLVVSFFATWCGPCKAGLPVIQRVARSEQGRAAHVSVLLVSYGQSADDVGAFLKELEIDLPVLADPYTTVGGRLGVDKRLPRTFVLDKAGNVRTIFTIEGADFEERLRAALLEAASPAAPAPENAPKASDAPLKTGAAFAAGLDAEKP